MSSVIHAEKERPLDARMLIFPAVLGIAFLAFFLRLWYLQVVESSALTERASGFRQSSVGRLAPRGLVVDRSGRLLAGVRQEIVITAMPHEVHKSPDVLQRLAQLLQVPVEKLQAKLHDAGWRPYVYSPIFVGAPIEVATKIAESPETWPGLGVESQPMRFYTDTKNFAHVLGYVWTPNTDDVRRLLRFHEKPSGYVGKTGLEYQYELALMGKVGSEHIEVDTRGRPIRSVGADNAVPGNKLVLSIDAELQRLGQTLLEGRRGAIVALDPTNGEVLCLVSSPTYDTSQFLGGISKTDYEKLLEDPDHPQLPRAMYTAYAPGSTFKLVTSMAGYLSGALSANRPVFCPGYYEVGSRRFKCLSHHGSITYHRALAKSCNTYFADLGMRSGEDNLRKACEMAGLGRKSGIDLSGEGKGVVPTDEWIKRWRKPPKWYPGDTVNFSVGQGELSVTPLQMANVVSLVANRGISYRPHVVRTTIPAGPKAEPEPTAKVQLGHFEADSTFWNMMIDAMQDVVENGTAGKARIPGIILAGKTGSAENRRNKETHSWFVGFAPIDHPKIAICVLVENAGHGGDVAAPLAAQVIRQYLQPTTGTKAN